MSLVFSDGSGSSVHFDPLTGQAGYVAHRSIWQRTQAAAQAVPRPVRWIATLGALWVAAQGAQWALLRVRHARRRRSARRCDDLEELVHLMYSIAPQHLGGFLTNASIQAVERAASAPSSAAAAASAEDDVARMLFFASGGWRFTPHSLSALPMALPYPSGSDAEARDARTRWWLALTLGKGMVLNGALAFLLSSMLLEADKAAEPDDAMRVRFRGRRIVDVGFCTGALYQNITPLQRAASAASSAAAASSASAIATPVPCLPLSKLEVVCEIGTMNASRVEAFQRAHWGQPPDPRSEALEHVADFGTARVLAHWRATGSLPDATRKHAALSDVIFERRTVNPPSGRDAWLWIDVERDPAAGGSCGEPERIHIDLAHYFSKGISPGFEEDRRAEASQVSTRGSSVWSNICSGLSSLKLRLSSLLPASMRPAGALSSSLSVGPSHALPRAFLLPDSMVVSSSRSAGLSSRITENARGARETIAMIQKLVLINSDQANPTHAQLRSLLLDALALHGVRNRHLTHKIAPPRKGRSQQVNMPPTGSSGAGGKAAWPEASVPRGTGASKARQSRSARARAAKRAAQQRSGDAQQDDEQDDDDASDVSDNDEEVIEINTAELRSEVDDVD